jgi:aspartyl-tRNA synthetase
LLRTHTCGTLGKEHVGAEVTLTGWVNRRRDHGNLIFIDLRDREGIVQTVFNPEIAPATMKAAGELRSEYVVRVRGKVTRRPEGTENLKIATGEIEIIAGEIEILNTSKTPPFYINEEVEVDESLRLKYRYLDLRHPRMRDNLLLRHKVIRYMRDFLDARGFVEVETPVLIKYYQIARCFRDEDTRADRQPEFTQLDIEMSFVDEDDIIELIEELFYSLVAAVKPEKRMRKPFPRLAFDEVMDRFGTDKPDMRFGMEIKDLSNIVAGTEFGVFQKALAGGGRVKGICAPGCAGYTRRQLDELNEMARNHGAGGLVTIALDASGSIDNLTGEMVKSAAARFLTLEQVRGMARLLGASPGDLLLIVAGANRLANTVLGELRREMGRRLKLADPDVLAFAFIVDYPLFERDSQTGLLQTTHHPFTMPKDKDLALLETAPDRVKAKCYDFICNGYELCSGSIRIHTSEMQKKIFRLLGYEDKVIEELFGHMLEAFDYGAPPHGGIAPGIDRVVMLLANEENIREVVAFPKNQAAIDLTFNAPSPVNEAQLKELHISLRED